MNTPIVDFVRAYASGGMRRLHMPGHKGVGPMGFEQYDITEIKGADALYEADGIIAGSEKNASALFGSGSTLYSTEGSSQCIRAMLHLAITQRPADASATIVAARNVHKAFVYSAALTGFDIEWLWPAGGSSSLCACPVSAAELDAKLASLPAPPAAVYVTSPDYLGGMQDICALAGVCHARGTILIVDNAHGAYLHFCNPAIHPLDMGADICCDSAHKTLPVITGGAYLHISKNAPGRYAENAKQAMALFGSTSPSYLILCSLDACNAELSGDYGKSIASTAAHIEDVSRSLAENGWSCDHTEPLKLTLHASDCGMTGFALAERLRSNGCECEYADADDVVLMLTPNNTYADIEAIPEAIGSPSIPWLPCAKGAGPAGPEGLHPRSPLPVAAGTQVMSVREAFFAPHETVCAADSLGRICAAPTVACPPAIPIAVSGEIITKEAVELFRYYGVDAVEVVKL